MKIGIAADHGGYKLKGELTKFLKKKGYNIIDYGTDSMDSVDYPDFAFKVAESVVNKKSDIGIAICKTGIGMTIACNKIKGARCAKIDSIRDARFAKEHNNANIIALNNDKPLFVIKRMISKFLDTKFSNEERHKKRLDKIERYENEH
jgi:ribose 5-phosphate isomerase B